MAVILVGMADVKVARAPDSLTTLGLGSCVGVCLIDPGAHVAGMAHIMLPTSQSMNGARAKFADTGIEDLLKMMQALGMRRANVYAKLAGGAHMFGNVNANPIMNIGERNIEACRRLLEMHRIPVRASDVGGKLGRTIEFSAVDGSLKIRAAGKPESFI